MFFFNRAIEIIKVLRNLTVPYSFLSLLGIIVIGSVRIDLNTTNVF